MEHLELAAHLGHPLHQLIQFQGLPHQNRALLDIHLAHQQAGLSHLKGPVHWERLLIHLVPQTIELHQDEQPRAIKPQADLTALHQEALPQADLTALHQEVPLQVDLTVLHPEAIPLLQPQVGLPLLLQIPDHQKNDDNKRINAARLHMW